jgi:hypothetical protein
VSKNIEGKKSQIPVDWANELVRRSVLPTYELLANKLDFSLKSLISLDLYLGDFYSKLRRASGPLGRLSGTQRPSDEMLATVIRLAGGYLGEVIRSSTGNHWQWHSYEVWCEENPQSRKIWGEKSLEVEYVIGTKEGVVWTPLNKAFKRIADGPADDVLSFAEVVISQTNENESKNARN